MKRWSTWVVCSAVIGIGCLVAGMGAGCRMSDPDSTPEVRPDAGVLPHTDQHPPSGSMLSAQSASTTGWKAYAIQRGLEQGAELHLENIGKHVLLPDAAPLGFSPDETLLLIVWTSPVEGKSGLAVIDLAQPDKPRLLTDAHHIPTPGNARDVRWSGHRIEYDLLGEADRMTVAIDLDSGDVATRSMAR